MCFIVGLSSHVLMYFLILYKFLVLQHSGLFLLLLLLLSGHACVCVHACYYSALSCYTVIVHLKPSFVRCGQCSSQAHVTVTPC